MTKIFISILVVAVIFGLLYVYGFMYAFRDFARSGNYPRPLETYSFDHPKQKIEENIFKISADNPDKFGIIDSVDTLFSPPLFCFLIKTSLDTTGFIVRFQGDSAALKNSSACSFALFGIRNHELDIDYKSKKNINTGVYREKVKQFEDLLIQPLKSLP